MPLKGHPLGEYTHNNILIGPAIGVGGTIYNLVTLKSTIFSRERDVGGQGGVHEESSINSDSTDYPPTPTREIERERGLERERDLAESKKGRRSHSF